jgi:hypothetical protein
MYKVEGVTYLLNQETNLRMTCFDIDKTDFGKSVQAKAILKISSVVRVSLVTLVLLALNLFTIYKYSQYLRKKQLLVNLNCESGLFFLILFLAPFI